MSRNRTTPARVLVLGALGLLLALAPAVAGARAAGSRIYVAARCSNHQMRPSRIVIACGDGNFYASHLRGHWRHWGARRTSATGRLVANDCIPFCAAGHFHSRPGRVQLLRVERCADGHRYYTRLRWHFTHAAPPHGRRGSTTIAPLDISCP